MDGHAIVCANGLRGFDTVERLTTASARAFFEHGYRYAVRYVRRDAPHSNMDLTADEAESLLEVGLGLMVVQYVESEVAWTPSGEKGDRNGEVAAEESAAIGLPHGVNVWCDLEGVEVGTPAEAVIEYCNRWHERVAGAGYLPGLYVGWHCGLNPQELYHDLRFTHYWGAYNLNEDDEPALRGLQMKQRAAKRGDRPEGISIQFDTDRTGTDSLGSSPVLLAPYTWP